MKIIAEAKKSFWDAFCKKANVDMDTAKKTLEQTIRKRLELRPDKDDVEIRSI